MNQTKAYFGDSMLIMVPPLLISIACAYLITQYIEQPVVSYLKKQYKNYTSRNAVKGTESGFAPQQIPEDGKVATDYKTLTN